MNLQYYCHCMVSLQSVHEATSEQHLLETNPLSQRSLHDVHIHTHIMYLMLSFRINKLVGGAMPPKSPLIRHSASRVPQK